MNIPVHLAYTIVGDLPPRVPLVVDSPHSWRGYPADFKPDASEEDLLTGWDAFVDELFGMVPDMGGILLSARFPRFYIDANRRRDDIDPDLLCEPWSEPVNPTRKSEVGMGLLRRYALPGVLVQKRLLTIEEVRHRIEAYYDPYVTTLSNLADLTVDRFGGVLHLNCHSMKSKGNEMNDDVGELRPDFVISDLDGRAAGNRFTELVAGLLADLGYKVSINYPYKGGDLIARTGRPHLNRHSIQIEVNRKLYMDEQLFEKTEHFYKLKKDIEQFVKQLCINIECNIYETGKRNCNRA